jgi:hypothetical protein
MAAVEFGAGMLAQIYFAGERGARMLFKTSGLESKCG